MKKIIIAGALIAATLSASAAQATDTRMDSIIDSLMSRMTLRERIGQLNFGAVAPILVVGSADGLNGAISLGLVGAMGGGDANASEDALRFAQDSMRVFVPMLTGLDVIHGHTTIFPIPLASASSWNMDLIRESARVAAREASANGVNWTFGPMVDISRDPRWGRVAEGAGEDPYLGSQVARAMVQGFQGDDLADQETIMACTKHCVLYGASESGKDYNTVSMDDVTAYNYYLDPYKAAFDAGAGSGMSSFNVVNGVPSTGNRKVLTDLFRHRWGFDGFIVSDAGSIGEMNRHGLGSPQEVSELALNAGLDMDLGSSHYVLYLEKALQEGKVSEADIDTACRRILEAKYRLGLLDNPWLYFTNKDKRAQKVMSAENLDAARRLARESIVLLKNDDKTLPLAATARKIAVVGPMGQERGPLLGCWASWESAPKTRTVVEALQEAFGRNTQVIYSQGSNWTEDYNRYLMGGTVHSDSLLRKAVADVADADLIIAAVGEPNGWSGEACNRAVPDMPRAQMNLLRAMKATGKPVVVVMFSGRPLVVPELVAEFPTIVQAWHGGTMASDALADVLTGKVAPSAKLTSTWPRAIGQIPIYYNYLPTGRPFDENLWCTTRYHDMSVEPLFPFGYGLSYNDYSYTPVVADKSEAHGDADSIRVSVRVKNLGKMTGKEIVQLYVRDPAARISRPVLELKDFAKIELKPGQEKEVAFVVTPDKLKYYDSDLRYDYDAGEFEIFVGPDSRTLSSVKVTWTK